VEVEVMPTTRKLAPVDYDIRFPFYSHPIPAKDMRFLPFERTLWVKTPDGLLSFEEGDGIHLWVRDCNLPLDLRQCMKEDGWEYMSMARFILLVYMDFLREY